MNDKTIFISATPKLAASNIAKAVNFYQQRLGFSKAFQMDDYASVKRDSIEIHLWQCNDKYIAENAALEYKYIAENAALEYKRIYYS